MHNNSPPLPPHTFWLLLMREKGIMMLYTPILLVLQIWLGFRCCSKIFVDLTSSGLMWNYSYSFSSMSVEPGPLLGNLAVLLGNFWNSNDNSIMKNRKNEDDNKFVLVFKIPKLSLNMISDQNSDLWNFYTKVINFFSVNISKISENSLNIRRDCLQVIFMYVNFTKLLSLKI